MPPCAAGERAGGRFRVYSKNRLAVSTTTATRIDIQFSGTHNNKGTWVLVIGRIKNPTTIGTGYTATVTTIDNAAATIDAGTSPAYPASPGFVLRLVALIVVGVLLGTGAIIFLALKLSGKL